MAFVREDADRAAGLVASIQKTAETHKGKGLQTFVVFQGGPELKEPLEKVASEKKISIPLTFLPQGTGARDFNQFKINPEAKNTIVLYKGKKVVANFVDVDSKSFEKVEKALAGMLN